MKRVSRSNLLIMGLILSITAGWSHEALARGTEDVGECGYLDEEIFLIVESGINVKLEIRQGGTLLHTTHEITSDTDTGNHG